jgi:hypothetical protein
MPSAYPSAAKERLASRYRGPTALDRRIWFTCLPLLCAVTRLFRLWLLVSLVRIRLRFVVGHHVSCRWRAFERHWPEVAGGIDGTTMLEVGASAP